MTIIKMDWNVWEVVWIVIIIALCSATVGWIFVFFGADPMFVIAVCSYGPFGLIFGYFIGLTDAYISIEANQKKHKKSSPNRPPSE